MDPKNGPGSLQRGQNKRQKTMFDFSLFFNAFLIDFGPPNGTLKSSQNLSRIHLGRPKAPQGRQKPPTDLQGAILKPLGGLQEPFWHPVRRQNGAPGPHFGSCFGHLWTLLWLPSPFALSGLASMLVPWCLPCRACCQASQDLGVGGCPR